ncbi:hypothetical protein FKP32DRAFT_1346638 [Trametes sanguinea]|nr:hypothetical protein FKP32DRAFT_1346638 [Trametes sanguinea]
MPFDLLALVLTRCTCIGQPPVDRCPEKAQHTGYYRIRSRLAITPSRSLLIAPISIRLHPALSGSSRDEDTVSRRAPASLPHFIILRRSTTPPLLTFSRARSFQYPTLAVAWLLIRLRAFFHHHAPSSPF